MHDRLPRAEPHDAGEAARPGVVPPTTAPVPLASVHTASFPSILRTLGVSLVVSTYQAGQLVFLRADGDQLNTHFRPFQRPMGVAVAGGRLAVGAARQVWEFHDVPAAGPQLDRRDGHGSPRHDACYLPRTAHFTGNVQVHEMAWAGPAADDLWFVNTRFSCLCTRAVNYNFVPRWRPPFVTRLAAEDRCHLNGLAVRDGVPRYVTALGETDVPGGWRAGKRTGGVVVDVATGEVVCRGLSMPHSPRWHDGHLWVLASGDGAVGRVDVRTGTAQTLATLPGFTRGLDFAGPFAFVGLSQVRESAVFSGIAIADRPVADRQCGVWAVDTRDGRVAGFVRFEGDVQEVFAVHVLRGRRWPELVTDDAALLADAFVLPDDALTDTRDADGSPERPA